MPAEAAPVEAAVDNLPAEAAPAVPVVQPPERKVMSKFLALQLVYGRGRGEFGKKREKKNTCIDK